MSRRRLVAVASSPQAEGRVSAHDLDAAPAAVDGRVPAHDLDAEGAVLCAVLEGHGLDRVLDLLQPKHFYSSANARIFEGALDLASRGTPVDVTTVTSWLRSRGRLEGVGGAAYVAMLVGEIPSVTNVRVYADIVVRKWLLRSIAATCQRVAAECYGDVGDEREFADRAEQALFELAHPAGGDGSHLKHIGTALREAFQRIEAAAARRDPVTGLATGLVDLDAQTAGFQEGDLVVLAARPSMGKTALAIQVALEASRGDDGLVAVFSQEMPDVSVATRAAALLGRIDLKRLRTGALGPEEWRRLAAAAAEVNALPLFIDDATGLTLLDVRAKLRRLVAERKRPVSLVVIDYLQLMAGIGDNREQEISGLSRGLKKLAGELRKPVVALSQLNRAVEGRKDKRPLMADLRDSGAIEQDADTIVFIYRDEYYNPETTTAKGIAELIIAKQRNGPTGTVRCRFDAACTRFDNLAFGQ